MLSILGSLAVGVAQFGASVFLSQYFQVARGHTPTEAGLLMLPLIVGNLIGATGPGSTSPAPAAGRASCWSAARLLLGRPAADGHRSTTPPRCGT